MRFGKVGMVMFASVAVMALAAGCKKKADKGKQCAELATRFSAEDPAKFTAVCKDSPEWAVKCMGEKSPSGDCLKKMADPAYMKLVDATKATPPAGGEVKPAGGEGAAPAGGEGAAAGEGGEAGGGELTAGTGDDLKFQIYAAHAAASTTMATDPTALQTWTAKVYSKLGISDDKGVANKEAMEAFNAKFTEWTKAHSDWVMNAQTDAEKSKAFVEKNLDSVK